MDTALFIIAAAGIGIFWWRQLRRTPPRLPVTDELQAVLDAAVKDARSRGQSLEPLHLFAALVVAGGLAALVSRLGGDVDAITRHITASLTEKLRAATALHDITPKARSAIERALAPQAASGRDARPVDLLAALLRVDNAAADACAAGGVRGVDLLFLAVHGVPEAELRAPDAPELSVVLVNDDVTTMEFVIEVLEEEFKLDPDHAVELMLKIHQTGRAEVGRFAAAEAHARAASSSAKARAQGFPLMVRLEA